MTGEHTQNPATDAEHKRGGSGQARLVRFFRNASPGPVRQLRPQEHGRAPGPTGGVCAAHSAASWPTRWLRRRKSAAQPWRWDLHPGGRLLTLPWPRHWAFRRKGVRDDGHPFRDHVIVGSLEDPARPLELVDRRGPGNGLSRALAPARRRARQPGRIQDGSRVGSRSRFYRLN